MAYSARTLGNCRGPLVWTVMLAGIAVCVSQCMATPPRPGKSAPPDSSIASIAAPHVNLHGRAIEDGAPVRTQTQNDEEFKAYYDAAVTAHGSTLAAFADGARRDLTYTHVYEEPDKYRGQIIHVEGRLIRLRKYEASHFVWDMGLRDLYEGWIYTANDGPERPWCVIFTDPPPGFQLGENLDIPVKFDGFFFKKYAFKARSGKFRISPLLIGHSLVSTIDSPAASSPSSLPSIFVMALLGLFAATVVIVIGLAYWYNRNDKRLRSRLAESNPTQFIHPSNSEGSLTDNVEETLHETDQGR